MEKIVPFLWFDDQAEEAANFYVSVFSKRPGAGTSRVRNITHYGEAGPRPAGMVMTVDFELEGHGITALNGGPEFSFTEALSLAVNCESQQEVDYLWTALSEGGEEGPCGWLKDGISPRAPVRRGSHRVPGPPTPRPTETPPATT